MEYGGKYSLHKILIEGPRSKKHKRGRNSFSYKKTRRKRPAISQQAQNRREKILNIPNRKMWELATMPEEGTETEEVSTKTLNNYKGQFGEVMTAVFFMAGLKFYRNGVIPPELPSEVQNFIGKKLIEIQKAWRKPSDASKGAWQSALPIMQGFHLMKKASQEDVDVGKAKKIDDSIKKTWGETTGLQLILQTVVNESRANANNFLVSLNAGDKGPKMPNGNTVGDQVKENMLAWGFATGTLENLQITQEESLWKVIDNRHVSKWVDSGNKGSKDIEVFTPANGAILWPALGGSARNQADLVYMGISLSVKVGTSAPGAINGGLAKKLLDMEEEIEDKHMAVAFGYVNVEEYLAAVEAGEIFLGGSKEVRLKNKKNRSLLSDTLISDKDRYNAKRLAEKEITLREEITLVVPEMYEAWGQAILDTWALKSSEYNSVKLDGNPVSADDLPIGIIAKTENGTVVGTGGSKVSLEDIIGGININIVGDGSVHINPTATVNSKRKGSFVWDNRKLVSFPAELLKGENWSDKPNAKTPPSKFTNLVGIAGGNLTKNVISNEDFIKKLCVHIGEVAALGKSAQAAQIAEEVLILSPTKKQAVRTSDYWTSFIDFWKILEEVHLDLKGKSRLGYLQDGNTAWFYVKKPDPKAKINVPDKWFKAFKSTLRRGGTSNPVSTIRADMSGTTKIEAEKEGLQEKITSIEFETERSGYQMYTDAELRAGAARNIALYKELDDSKEGLDMVKREFARVIKALKDPSTVSPNLSQGQSQMNAQDKNRITQVVKAITSPRAYYDRDQVMKIIAKFVENPRSVTEDEQSRLIDMLDGIYIIDGFEVLSDSQDPEKDALRLGPVRKSGGSYYGDMVRGISDSYSLSGQLLSEQLEKLPQKISSLEDLMAIFEKALEVIEESKQRKYSITSRLFE